MSPTRQRRAPVDAIVLGRPTLTLLDADRESVAQALAALLVARALADEASEAEAAAL